MVNRRFQGLFDQGSLALLLVIVENGVKLRLNIVDTPGYGDQVNNENWYGHSTRLFVLLLSVVQLGSYCEVHQGPAQRVLAQRADGDA